MATANIGEGRMMNAACSMSLMSKIKKMEVARCYMTKKNAVFSEREGE